MSVSGMGASRAQRQLSAVTGNTKCEKVTIPENSLLECSQTAGFGVRSLESRPNTPPAVTQVLKLVSYARYPPTPHPMLWGCDKSPLSPAGILFSGEL